MVNAIDDKDEIFGPKAVRGPEIVIELSEPELYAKVEPGEDGIVVSHGILYCDMPPGTPPGQYCVITLQAMAGGWAVSGAPSLTFDRSTTEQPFSISVQVPVETSQKTGARLTVEGKWRYSPGTGGGTIDPVFCIIHVLPYGSPKLAPVQLNSSIPIGSWREIEVLIINEGNSNDIYSLSVDSKPDDVEAYFVESEITISEKRQEIVILKVKQVSGSSKFNEVVIRASSIYDGKRANVTEIVRFESSTSLKSIFTNTVYVGIFLLILMVAAIVIILIIRRSSKKGKFHSIMNKIRSGSRA